jgi:hypothetical protein
MDWISIVGAGLGAGLGALIAQLLVRPGKERKKFNVVSLLIGVASGLFVWTTFIGPPIRVWETKREFRASPFFSELSVYDPTAYAKFESLYVEIVRNGATKQKASLGMGDELIRIVPKYMLKASDESVVAFGSWMVASLEELHGANSDACYSFLFPHKFGEAELVKANMSAQSGDKSLQVMQGIIVSALKNPQSAPDEKKVDELLQPIIRNLVGTYGSDLKLMSGTAMDGPERKKVCEMATEMYREILSLPPADASTVLRNMLSLGT